MARIRGFFFLIFMTCIVGGCAGPGAAPIGNYNIETDARMAEAVEQTRQGEYEKALAVYGSLLADYRSEKNELGVMFCLEKMGWLEREIGQYDEALKHFREARPIGIRLHGDAAEIDAHLGDVYLFSGDSEKAERHYRAALDALKDYRFPTTYLFPPGKAKLSEFFRKNAAILHARDMLGVMRFFEGQYKDALENLKVAKELIDDIEYVAGHSLYGLFIKLDADYFEGAGYCLTTMGATYARLNRYEEAETFFEQGKAEFEKGDRPFGLLFNKALQYEADYLAGRLSPDSKRFGELDEFIKKAESFGAGEIAWRTSFIAAKLLADDGRIDQSKMYMKKAIDILELIGAGFRQDAIKKMFVTSSSVQEVYGRMVDLCYRTGKFDEGFGYLERGRARAFLDSLAGRSVSAENRVDPVLVKKEKDISEKITVLNRRLRAARGEKREKLNAENERLKTALRDVLDALRYQSLEYAATTSVAALSAGEVAGRIGRSEALVSYLVLKDKVLIWLVANGRVSAYSSPVSAEELHRTVNNYRRAVVGRQEKRVESIGRKLSDILLSPVLPKLKGKRKLYIVPSQSLHHLPFAGLPLSGGKNLIHNYTISILPNASSLMYMGKNRGADTTGSLILGNPETGGALPPLKFAEEEARLVAKTFSEPVLRIGAGATETAIKSEALNRAGVIHVAAHGVFNPLFPMKSSVFLAPDDQNDGRLEVFEIYSTHIGSSLVVLSACETGLGKAEGGGEVLSINRAFIYAGAGGVVSSLWNVADEATFELMVHFYSNLKKDSAGEALRKAQLELMQKYPQPYYWAAFYLTGLI